MDVCLPLVSVVRCQADVSASGRSLVQMSPIECGVSKCDFQTSTMMKTRSVRAVQPRQKRNVTI